MIWHGATAPVSPSTMEVAMTDTGDVKAKATEAVTEVTAKAAEIGEKVKEVVADVVGKHADKPADAVKTTTDLIDDKTGGKTAPVSGVVNQAAQAATGAVKTVAGVTPAEDETTSEA